MSAFGGVPSPFPPAEDDQLREQRDLARRQMENAAARSLEASTIGEGGLLVKDGGSITVEAPGTIDLQGGAFAAASVSTTGTIGAGSTISTPGTVQGGAVVSTGSASVAVDLTVGGSETVTGPIYSPHGRANPVTTSYVSAWLNDDGRIGASASSLQFKQDVEPADTTAEVNALLTIALIRYRYIADVEAHGDAAPWHLGTLAEYMAETALREWVPVDQDGNPFAINWEHIIIPAIAALQSMDARLKALEAKLA